LKDLLDNVLIKNPKERYNIKKILNVSHNCPNNLQYSMILLNKYEEEVSEEESENKNSEESKKSQNSNKISMIKEE